jgi:hypothetical protein
MYGADDACIKNVSQFMMWLYKNDGEIKITIEYFAQEFKDDLLPRR